MAGVFQGFSDKTLSFYRGLAKNNTKEWFDAHRDGFDDHVMDPARAFVFDMGASLKKIAPGITADPRVNRSLFRINRDTRFSKDKTPYKTHLAIWFWEGDGPRMECSGYYFHLEPGRLMLGAGIYRFPKHLLEEYRQSVVHAKHGPALAKAVTAVEKAGYGVGVEHYKRVPRGFDPDHKYAGLLKHSGLTAMVEMPIPNEIHSPKLIDLCVKHYRRMAPLHKWLLAMTERAAK